MSTLPEIEMRLAALDRARGLTLGQIVGPAPKVTHGTAPHAEAAAALCHARADIEALVAFVRVAVNEARALHCEHRVCGCTKHNLLAAYAALRCAP